MDYLDRNVIYKIMLMNSFQDTVAFALTSKKYYETFRKNVHALLIHNSLVDTRNLCRYDIVDVIGRTNENYMIIKYAVRYNAVNILKNNTFTRSNYHSYRYIKYIYHYKHYNFLHIVQNYFNRNNTFTRYNKFFENFYNGTHPHDKNNKIQRKKMTNRVYTHYIFTHNFESEIYYAKTSDLIDYNYAIKTIIKSKNYHLLNYIEPSQVNNKNRRHAVKYDAKPVIDWFNKNISTECKCGFCYSGSRHIYYQLKHAICEFGNLNVSQNFINDAFMSGDSRCITLMRKHNLKYTGNYTEEFTEHTSINTLTLTPQEMPKFITKNIEHFDVYTLRYILEYYPQSKKIYQQIYNLSSISSVKRKLQKFI